MSKFVVWFTKITGWPVQFLCFRTKIYYENKNSQSRKISGPAIIVSNHTSIFDYAVFLFVFFFRTVRYQMAEVLFKKKFLGTFLKLLGGIYVDRFSHNFSFIGESVDILQKGGVVGIFPESRLPLKDEERPLPFTPHLAYVAHKSGCPIIPVYTNGKYFSKERARVIIGEKIDVDSFWNKNKSDDENYEMISSKVRKKVIKLGKELDNQVEDEKTYKPHNYFLFDFAKITAAIPVLLWLRPKYIYENENAKVKQKGAVIYSANHNSFTDPVAMMLGIYYRRLHILATKELFDKKGMGFLFKQFHCICVDKENFSVNSFNEILYRLKKRQAVGIFPEGGINTNDQTVNSFKSGIVLMAYKGESVIVPMFLKKRIKFLDRQKIVIGEPCDINKVIGDRLDMNKISEISEILKEKEIKLMEIANEN